MFKRSFWKQLPPNPGPALRNKLPILLLNNPTWLQFCAEFNAAIEVNPDDFDAKTLLNTMKTKTFYDRGNASSSLWSSEKPKLLNLLEELSGQ